MTFEVMQSIFSVLFGYGLAGAIGSLVVLLLVKYLFPGYLLQKGKNLATKEDIENITNKVESIRSGYAEILEEIKSNNQIKIAAIEREKAMKKEVYMEIVEALTQSQNMINSLANLNSSEEQITSVFYDCSGKVAKVLIVGEKDTILAVTSLDGAIATAFLDLMPERTLLIQRRQEIELLERGSNKHENEVERYVALIKNLNLEGNSDQDKWNYINNSIKLEWEESDKLNDKIDTLQETQAKEHLRFVEKCRDRFFDISKFFPEAVLSIRRELELEIDVNDYLEIFESNLETSKALLNDFIAKIKAQIASIKTGA